MPRRAVFIVLIALFSLGLLSVYPVIAQTAQPVTPTAADITALKEEVTQLRRELAEDRMARKEFALEMRLLEKDMEGWHTSTKTISELMRPTGDWIRGYFNLIMGIVAVLVTVFVGIIGGLFRREVQKVKEVDKEAKELRDRTEGYMKEASQVIEEMESRKEAMDEAFAKQDKVIAKHVEQAVQKIDEEKERAARFGQFMAEGFRKFEQGNYEAVLKAVEQALAIDDESAVAWTGRGAALGSLDRNEEALEAHEKAIGLDPELALAWKNKGVILGRLDRYEEALEASEKAIELDPNDADTWANKGLALVNMGRHEESLEASEKAIELDPNDADIWSNRAAVLLRLGRYGEALSASEEAIKLNPEHAPAWFNKACAHSKLGQKPEMLGALKRAIELDPKFKEKAKTDEDFEPYRDDPDFRALIFREGQ